MKTTGSSTAKPSTIRVAVRIRPVLPEELQKGLSANRDKLKVENNTTVRIVNKLNIVKGYAFDQVFEEDSTQESIFRRTRTHYLINQVLLGFHATIFVYGQTGSGKTFTMEGYKYVRGQNNILVPQIKSRPSDVTDEDPSVLDEEGIIPRAIRELFSQVEQKRKETQGKSLITVKVQYIQLYNEKVYDLLNSNAQKAMAKKQQTSGLRLKMNAVTDEVTIENVYVFDCANEQEAFKYFTKGLKNKVMSSHNMNQSSSRSHCILTFVVQQVDLSQANASAQIVSKLQLVDLAGSERQSHTTSTDSVQDPTQFKEAIEINKSLFTLRQVITALTDNNSASQRKTSAGKPVMNYVPYRESKLTTILKQSLGGNSFTLMIACLAPIDLYSEENISTLNYAARAAKISNAPSINMDPKLKQIMEQKRTIERLKQELKRANDQIKFLTMGGCSCKLEATASQSDNSKKVQSSQLVRTDTGFTINNNYNNNTISIIDGNTITTSTSGGAANGASSSLADGVEGPQDQSVKSSGNGGEAGLQRDRSGVILPMVAQAHLNNSEAAIKADGAYSQNQMELADQSQAQGQPKVNMSVLSGQKDRGSTRLDRSVDGTGQKTINFSITQSQFNAMQDQVRSKLGMTMPMLGGHANLIANGPYTQDRLITSISIVKDVLISNMQLREDLLQVSQEHDNTMQANFQLMIENEDLRDRLSLVSQQDGTSIDYLPYLNHKQLEGQVNKITDPQELQNVKNMVLTHLFSLRKDNRQLTRRIKNFEEKYQERKAMRAAQSRQNNQSRQNSILTDLDQSQGARNCDTENSIELYPEFGPHTPTIDAVNGRGKKSMRYGTSKDGQSQRRSKKTLNKLPPNQILDTNSGHMVDLSYSEIRASSVDQEHKNVAKFFNQGGTEPQSTRITPIPLLPSDRKKNQVHTKLQAIEKVPRIRKTANQGSRTRLETSQDFYQAPVYEAGTFGPTSPLKVNDAAIEFEQPKRSQRATTNLERDTPVKNYSDVQQVASRQSKIRASKAEGRSIEVKKTGKKKNKIIYALPQVTMIPGGHNHQSQIALKLPVHNQSIAHQQKAVNQSLDMTRNRQSMNNTQANQGLSTHRPKSRNAVGNATQTIPIKPLVAGKNSRSSKRKLINAGNAAQESKIQQRPNAHQSESRQNATTPELKKKQKLAAREVAASHANMSLNNRLQQRLVRDSQVKQTLRNSHEFVDRGITEASSPNEATSFYKNSSGLPSEVHSVRHEGSAAGKLQNAGSNQSSQQQRQAVLDYIRHQENKMASSHEADERFL